MYTMKIGLTSLLILLFLAFSYHFQDGIKEQIGIHSKEYIKVSPDILKSDDTLYTGWYFINDNSGYRRKLDKTQDSYYINPTPIVIAKNFKKVNIFHEKDCYALLIWLDDEGAEALHSAKQKPDTKKLAFLIDNRLVSVQLANDPQFAQVEKEADPRIYGQVLAFPCKSVPLEELKNYKIIIESEKSQKK
jgi:hypothetical protein